MRRSVLLLAALVAAASALQAQPKPGLGPSRPGLLSLRGGASLKEETSLKGAPPFVRKPKFELEMKAARKQLKELEKLENTKGVLPLAEVEKLNAKPKLLSDLAAMEAEAAGWFSQPTEAMPAA